MKSAAIFLMFLALVQGQYVGSSGGGYGPPGYGPQLESTALCYTVGYGGPSDFPYCVHSVLGSFLRDIQTYLGIDDMLVEFLHHLSEAHSMLGENLDSHPGRPVASTFPPTGPGTEHIDLNAVQFELETDDGVVGVRSGRLIAMLDGQRGTVCDDLFDDRTAEIICRRIFYYDPTLYVSWTRSANNDPYTDFILLDDVTCVSEDVCSGITQHNCNHYEDVVLTCSDQAPAVDIFENYVFTLLGPDGYLGSSQGRLIATNLRTAEEGTVCDDLFDTTIAGLICQNMFGTEILNVDWRTAGYTNETVDYPIVLDNIRCENGICTGETQHNCNHFEDVILDCSGQGQYDSSYYSSSYYSYSDYSSGYGSSFYI